MKKANNILEISLILCFVVTISIVTFTIYNNHNLKLSKLSNIQFSSQSINVATASTPTLNKNVPYNRVETAGTNALTYMGVSSSKFDSAVSQITYGQLKAASADSTNNIFTLANSLITKLNLGYTPVSSEGVNSSTLSTMIGILNAAVSAIGSSSTDDSVKSLAKTYVTQFESLSGLS